MFDVRRECGHCHQLGDHTLLFAYELQRPIGPVPESGRTLGGTRIIKLNDDDEIQGGALASCPLCAKPSLLIFSTRRKYFPNILDVINKSEQLFGGQSLITLAAAYPKSETAHDQSEWPENIRAIFIDAQDMLRQGKSPSIVIATCRSVLDVATKSLGGTKGNLGPRIDELAERGVITKPLQRWAHHVKMEGNEAIHEIVGTKDEAAELVEFVRMFLDMTFTLPKRIEAKATASVLDEAPAHS